MSRSPLFVIFLIVFIDLLGFGIVLPLLPRYGEHFDAPGWQLGLLMASFSAMQFLFAPLWGRLSDRIGRRPVLLVGLAGSTVAYGAFGLITQLGNQGDILGVSPLTWLFVSRIAAGIAGATIPTAQAYIADVTTAETRGKGMALIGMAFGIGFTFGPIIGAQFVTEASEPHTQPSPAPGYVAAVLSGIALIAAFRLLPESLRPGTGGGGHRAWLDLRALGAAMARPHVGWIFLSIFLSTLAFAQFENTLSLLTERLGLGARANFYVFAYIGAILIVAQGVFVRRYLPRIGEHAMALGGVLLMTAGLTLIGVAAEQATLTTLYWVLPLTVVGFSATTPSLQSLLSLNTPEDEQGAVLGVGQSLSSLARILGPIIGLSLHDYGVAIPYWLAAATMALAVPMIAALKNCRSSTNPGPTDAGTSLPTVAKPESV